MKLQQVAVQLYTLRDHLKTPADIAQTLRRVRTIGFQAVQVSGMGPIEPAELVNILQGEGLTLCATHEPALKILDETQAVIDRLLALNCSITAYPHPAGVDMTDAAQVQTLIQKLNAAGRTMADAGLTLCYHNHAAEFYKLNGRPVLDIIYAETDPNYVKAELDTYWVQMGGHDVVAYINKVAGRQPIMHIKDCGVNRELKTGFCEIGNGNLPWKEIIAAADAGGTQWYAVEQDTCPGDPFDSLQQSFDYISANLV